MDPKLFYEALQDRYKTRFNQYEEFIEAINTMTDNCNIIRKHLNKNELEYIDFAEIKELPGYHKKRVDRNITDAIMAIATLETRIQKLINHKNKLIQELTGRC